MSYVWALLGFCALIILHEGGHFAAAKAVGMRVEKFSLFFGPMIVQKTIGETTYGIGTIPLGGFVKITGMSPEEVFEEPSVEARAYVNQPVWKRIVVILAGPVVNLVIAFAIFFLLFLHNGAFIANAGREIPASVTKGSPLGAVLQKGDQFISVNGQKSIQGVRRAVAATHCAGPPTNGCAASPAVTVVVKRNGRDVSLKVHPRYVAADKRLEIGIGYAYTGVTKHLDAVGASRYSVTTMGQIVGSTFSTLARIWQSKERKQLQGVVGIYAITQQAVNEGPSAGLSILAEVSLALGVFNLLPFLPLDGGHIFWALVEKLRRRRTSLLTMERASWVGLALVLVLFVIGLSNSITTLTHGGYHLH